MSKERNFKSKKGPSDMWDPRKDAEGNKLEANDKSYIEGFYLGAEHDQGPKKNSQVHTIQGFTSGKEKAFWGSMLLDEMLGKVTPGQFVRVLWLGLKQPKGNGQEYHDWDVLVDEDEAPLDVNSPTSPPKTKDTETKEAEPQAAAKPAAVLDDAEGDNLPF